VRYSKFVFRSTPAKCNKKNKDEFDFRIIICRRFASKKRNTVRLLMSYIINILVHKTLMLCFSVHSSEGRVGATSWRYELAVNHGLADLTFCLVDSIRPYCSFQSVTVVFSR